MNFKSWLIISEQAIGNALPPSRFINPDGSINLYRYSKAPRGETYVIDPAKAKPNRYSSREFQAAATPRTFFYLDPLKDKESFIGNHLYEVEYQASKIYNVLVDPAGLKEKASGTTLPDGTLINQGILDFDKLLKIIREHGYDGMYYKPGGMEVVTMFVPVVGKAISEEKLRQAA